MSWSSLFNKKIIVLLNLGCKKYGVYGSYCDIFCLINCKESMCYI